MGEKVIYLFGWLYIMWLAYIEIIGNNKAFTIFTGDLTSHDNDNQLSRAYVEYVQSAIYSLFKAYLAGPVYAVLVCLFFYLLLYFSINVLDRVTMTRGPKLLMHLTAYSQRLFQISLNGTMLIWQSKRLIS
jgi:hypothetical protein